VIRVGLGLGGNLPVRRAVEYARYAEARGLDSCWLHEAYWNRDSLSYLTAIAVTTRRVRLGTGCINPYTRHPVLVASSLATLDELSGGRAAMGIGTGYPARLRELGIAHPHPVEAMRESIGLIRRLWQGERVTHEGPIFSLASVSVNVRPGRPIPVYLAGWGPRMLRLAGELCDGYLARAMESPVSCRRLLGAVREAARAHKRDPYGIDSAAYILCAVDRSRDAARAAMRRDPFVVYQLAVIDEQVLAESGVDPGSRRRIAEPYWRAGAEEASRQVGDELLDAFTLAGTADDVLARLATYVQAGVSLPILQPVSTSDDGMRRVIDVGREFLEASRPPVQRPERPE
jgi:5,10-methylenetetrahydromethanopterin reductase